MVLNIWIYQNAISNGLRLLPPFEEVTCVFAHILELLLIILEEVHTLDAPMPLIKVTVYALMFLHIRFPTALKFPEIPFQKNLRIC